MDERVDTFEEVHAFLERERTRLIREQREIEAKIDAIDWELVVVALLASDCEMETERMERRAR